uniref:non-specific lipid transfer protein GPI-anchored 5-like n=1 Tax=Erigeron canadensis TaxID=72917 RepID=UPI001CB9B775|nr:non-specific lipid transfer protein GPI-anchored 5-like [Erigeron canadensis]
MTSNGCWAFDPSFVMVMLVLLCGRAIATTGCKSAIISLSPCINFVCGSSTTPSSTCCTQLANVVESQPRCLCKLISGGPPLTGFTVNKTLALELPHACNIHTPPVSRCDGNVSQTVPAVPPTTSEGTTITFSFYFVYVVFILVASNLCV